MKDSPLDPEKRVPIESVPGVREVRTAAPGILCPGKADLYSSPRMRPSGSPGNAAGRWKKSPWN